MDGFMWGPCLVMLGKVAGKSLNLENRTNIIQYSA